MTADRAMLAVSRGPRVLVQFIAVNIRFLLALCKESAGNVFCGLQTGVKANENAFVPS